MGTSIKQVPNEWNAVFNDVIVEQQRQDFIVDSISGITVTLSFGGSADLDIGHYVYIWGKDAGNNEESGFRTITNKFSNTVFEVDISFSLLIVDGFLNSDDVKKGYYIALLIEDVYLKLVPDATGLVTANIGENLVYLLNAENNKDYGINYTEENTIAKKFNLSFAEVYNDTQSALIPYPDDYYCLFAALNYTDMVDFVIEPIGTPNTFFAKFLTQFTELAYWENQRFDVQIINSYSSLNLRVVEEAHFFNGGLSVSYYNLPDTANTMNRIMLQGGYGGNVKFVNLYIYDTVRGRLTEKLKINIYNECPNSLNVSWINTKGGIDHWNFILQQDVGINVSVNNTIYLKDEEFDYSKTANETIVIYANDVSQDYVSGLKGLLYCLQAFAYIDGVYEKVRVQPGSFELYRTDLNKFSIQVTLIRERLKLGHL